jgi:mycobactin lysine-N-oxygenase
MNRSVDIAVIGAGPKGAAIAAKVHVLNTLGLADINLLVLERSDLASSWNGKNGFTTGSEELGTRPEKDVAFPYQSFAYGIRNLEVDAAMIRFSWQSYLIAHGKFRRWIDGGASQPTHHEFAHYLSWVFSCAVNGVCVRQAEVKRVDVHNDGWLLQCQLPSAQGSEFVMSRGIVMTGTGSPRELACACEIKGKVFTSATDRRQIAALNLGPRSSICIAGVGESAASMALFLIDQFGEEIELTFIAPTLPSSRAESYLENSVYSDPQISQWERIPEPMRMDFIARADRGVMSPTALARLMGHRNLSFVFGKVRCLQRSSTGCVTVIVDQSDEVMRGEYDAVANCIGFSSLAPLASLLGDAKQVIEEKLGISISNVSEVARNLDQDFALRGLTSRVHLPALAGLLYGPGFSNLSCLGTMSDRVLAPYIDGNAKKRASCDETLSEIAG